MFALFREVVTPHGGTNNHGGKSQVSTSAIGNEKVINIHVMNLSIFQCLFS